jgi:acyl-CoA thioesterase I
MKKLSFLLIILLSVTETVFSQSTIKIACVGNSITEGPGRENPDSYPLQMQAMIGKGFEVRNFGVSGRTLLKKGDFPYWNEPQFDEVKQFAPDKIIIMLGTNDSKPQNWQYKTDFKQDYIDLIKSFRSTMPKNGIIYVVIPVPVSKDNFGIRESVLVDEMRPLLREIAAETGSKIIDLHTPLKNHKALFADGVHPNNEGLGIMAAEIAKAIK